MHVPGAPVAVAACIAVAAGLAAYYAVRATAWAVMTDELQVARLATSIAETLSPVPYVHGVYYGALSQLYPLLLAPLYGTLSAPAAQTAAHALNGLLLAGAAWPAYLLGRSVGGSRAAGLVAAALTAFTPWLALSSTLLTENAAYPAFVWAVFLCHRAIAAPSAGRDLGALAGLVLAFFARTQLFVLALALPVAVVLHEVVWARREKGGLRAAAGRHRVLVGAYAGGAAGAGRLVLAGALGNVVGNYATPFHGELLPAGFWGAVAAHLVQVVVGSGVLPFALAASWAATSLIRPHSRSGHAFAALFAVLVPLLTFEVTSFDLRFTPNRFIQDRYLVYLVPLFAVGAAAWLAQRTDWKLRVASLALVGAGLVALLGWIKLDDPIIFWAAPGAAVQPALAAAADHVGLSTELFLRLATVAALLAVAAAAWRLPRASLTGTAAALAALGILQAWYVLDRYADPVMTREPASGARDWIDAAVPTDRSVALVPSPLDAPTYWWEAELWNKQVDRVLRVGRGRTYTPFPADRVRIDYADGRLSGAEPTSYLVLSRRETRFRLAGATPLGRAAPLRLVHVRRPYRLAWAMRGVTADGWTRPGQTARLRLYGHGGAARRRIVLTLAASRFASKPIEFELRGGEDVVRGGVDPGGARPPVRLRVCVPAGGHADAALTTAGSSRLPDGRVVALHLDGLEVEDAGACG